MTFLNSGSNPAAFFQNGPYPGSGMFYNALRYNMGQEFGPQGDAAGNLARATATDEGAARYYSDMPRSDPGSGAAQAGAQGQFGNLLQARAAAENAAAMANAQTKSQAGQGILNVASAYGNDINQSLQAEQALKNAQAATSTNVMGDITGGLETAAGIGSEIVAPGNPMGLQMTMNGAGTLMNNGHSSGGGGMGGMFSGLLGGSKGGSPSGSPSTAGFAMPGASGTPTTADMSGSLPSFIDPNQIAGVSVDQGMSPGMAAAGSGSFSSFLSGLGGWF